MRRFAMQGMKSLPILVFFFLPGLVISPVFAQDQNKDYCQRHPELFDNNGRLTLEAHKMIHHLDGPEYWYDSQAKETKPFPSKSSGHNEPEHQELMGGPYWWYDSHTKEWKPWPAKENKMSLDCYKKLYLSGWDWWYDSKTKEWKQVPK